MTGKKKRKKKKGDQQHSSFWRGIKRHFLTGIATLFPLFITVYIIVAIVNFADNLVGSYVNAFLYSQYGFKIPGLGLVVTVVFIIGVGIIYNVFFGRKLFPLFEGLFKKIPLIANIYPSAKQLSNFMFSTEKKENFKKVVLVQFPEKGTYSIGFVTNEEVGKLNGESDEELVSVFIPLAPLPFSGHILLVPKNKFREIDMPINQAIKFVVSGGVVLSSDKNE